MLRTATYFIWGAVLGTLIGFGIARADGNSYQPYQPFRNNFIQRVSSGYDYGHPAGKGGGVQSNVVCQYDFTEASGNIVDEVNSYSLAAVGSPTYQADSSSYSSNMEYAITYDGSANRHASAVANSELDIPVDQDFTVEWVAEASASWTSVHYYWSILSSGGAGFGVLAYQNNGATLNIYTLDDSGGPANVAFTLAEDNRDGVYRKFRVPADKDGNISLYIDGVQQAGTASMAGANTDAITNAGLMMGGQYNGSGADLYGSLNEWRMTKVLDANSGGPGGG